VEEKVVETIDLSAAFKSQSSKQKSQIIYLRLDGDFQPGHNDVANFYYSLDGEEWTKIGTENYRMIFDYRRFFMGSKFGIFNYATKKAGGYVDVDEFCYSKTEK
jgi:beta-xylosidase